MNIEIDDDVPLVPLCRGLATVGLVIRTNPNTGRLCIERSMQVEETPAVDFYFGKEKNHVA